jgi:glycosyltransferase involved in cell wall biosynthesis
MRDQNTPLVSIGLPTYNRPLGLKQTLDSIAAQKYPAIEIIVSDNCSAKEFKIKALVDSYIAQGLNIIFYEQPVNNGAFFNFKFVLEKATGEYFMWFADDDYKNPLFIKESLRIIGDAGGAFGTYAVKNNYKNTTYVYEVPLILKAMPLHKQMFRFINVFPSVYIYGLFRRTSLDFFLKEELEFDFFDGYFAMNVLMNHGLNVVPTEIPITILGINEKEYVPKPFKKEKNRTFFYNKVISNCCKLIINSKKLNFFWKIPILLFFLTKMLKEFITFEHKYNPVAWLLNYIVRIPLRFIYRVSKRVRN